MYSQKVRATLNDQGGDDQSGKSINCGKEYHIEYNDAYSNLNKTALVQESNIFNEKNLGILKCVDLLNKTIFLLN
jgi:hypothetical protein